MGTAFGTWHRPCAGFLAGSALAACGAPGLDREAIVELHGVLAPEGVLELEYDRQGILREAEADVPLASVPAELVALALARLPGGEITGAEREITEHGKGYELKLARAGLAYEYVFDDSGRLLESEEELGPGELPEEVLRHVELALGGGERTSTERVTRGDKVEYHVKKEKDGMRYKIVLAENGALLAVVREARAEVEVPLR